MNHHILAEEIIVINQILYLGVVMTVVLINISLQNRMHQNEIVNIVKNMQKYANDVMVGKLHVKTVDVFYGKSREYTYKGAHIVDYKELTCNYCKGSGFKDPTPCESCSGCGQMCSCTRK
jgi:hypothetical protein